MRQDEALRELAGEVAGDDGALIWVCRDIAGNHCGGPGCFCDPFCVRADDEAAVRDLIDRLQAGQTS